MNGNKHFVKAQELLLVENYKEAQKQMLKALGDEPNNADFHSELGVILFHLKKKLEAIDALNKALQLDPENPYRYSSRAYLKDSLGDTQGAIDDYLICIKLDPEDAIAHNNLGLLEEKLGRKQSAEKRFKKADELAAILEENNISFSKDNVAEKVAPRNVQKEIQEQRKEYQEKGKFGIMLDVLRDRKTRKEFMSFLKGGFKSDDEGLS